MFVVLGTVALLAACSNPKAAGPTTTNAPVTTTTMRAVPRMSVTPDTDLVSGESVTILAAGFPANEQLGITECANKAAPNGAGDCNVGAIKVVKASVTGTMSAAFTPVVGPFGLNKIVCTQKPGCIISVAEAGSTSPTVVATATITFNTP
jgi:hypothetical protein